MDRDDARQAKTCNSISGRDAQTVHQVFAAYREGDIGRRLAKRVLNGRE